MRTSNEGEKRVRGGWDGACLVKKVVGEKKTGGQRLAQGPVEVRTKKAPGKVSRGRKTPANQHKGKSLENARLQCEAAEGDS